MTGFEPVFFGCLHLKTEYPRPLDDIDVRQELLWMKICIYVKEWQELGFYPCLIL